MLYMTHLHVQYAHMKTCITLGLPEIVTASLA